MKKILGDIYMFFMTGRYLSFKIAVFLVFLAIGIGMVGFMLIEEYSVLESFYMTIITISTVGFSEVKELSDQGKIFTSFLIIFNIGIFAYAASAFSFYIIKGEIFKNMHLNIMQKKINDLDGHTILCGYGKYGSEIVEHFSEHGINFIVIDSDPEVIDELSKDERRILYIEDDATHEDVLEKARIEHADVIVSALPDDSDNLFTVLSARQINPKIKIISRARESKTIRKLQLAGADHVIMPEQIGGYYMATLVTKPYATEFFSFITDEIDHDIGFEEISYEALPDTYQGRMIKDMSIRPKTGANIIGFKESDGTYTVNPEPDTQMVPGTSIILIGSSEQLSTLRAYLKNR